MLTDDRISEQLWSYFEWIDAELGTVETAVRDETILDAPMGQSRSIDKVDGRRTRVLVVAACVALVVGSVAAIAVFARPTHTDDGASGPAVSATATGESSEAPSWYEMISPYLPSGFEHVTVSESNDKYVTFEAFDPSSSKSLHFMVSRVAIAADPDGSITLEQARTEPWDDRNADLNVSLPDRRQVGVYCTFARPMPNGGCPKVNGNSTMPDDLRRLAVALATEIDLSRLPEPASELDHVSIAEIRAVTDRVIEFTDDSIELEAPHYSSSFVQFGDASLPDLVTVRTISGFYPALPPTEPRTTVSIGGYRLTWQVAANGVLWLVADNPTAGRDVAGNILNIAIDWADTAPTEPSQTTTTNSDNSSAYTATLPAEITWYTPDDVGAVLAGDELVCTTPDDGDACAALAGTRTVTFRTDAGQVDVITEYGPAESTWWQELARAGEPTDLAGHPGWGIADNDELVGFTASPEVRVTLVGEAGTNPADLVTTLVALHDNIDVPAAFGQALATEAEFPRDAHVGGVNARYYAGYLDTTASPPCIGGIGVPWNGSSCIPVEPDTLSIAIASPSPTGTILIASVPLRASTAIVTARGGEQRELPITDASDAGFKLVFADLDGLIPDELVAIDDVGEEIARAPITSTAGAPLGYLKVGFGD